MSVVHSKADCIIVDKTITEDCERVDGKVDVDEGIVLVYS